MADPSDNACIERLVPKTVPTNLIALGTITDISSLQLRIQITGGVVCLVDRFDINQVLTKLIKQREANSLTGPRLIDLFKVGQQYVCKITERRTRKGYAEAQDIIASLDPSELQEDNLPSTILDIPNVPLQCAVLSVEDHGYRMDIGFKNIAGFLSFDEVKEAGRKFTVGQLLRCSSKEVMNENSRVLQLTMLMDKLSHFNQEKCGECTLTPRCILPGSKGFLTVMKVQKEGLVVNFLDEFAGFVGLDHLKEEWSNPLNSYKIADRFKCTVLYFNPTTNIFCLSLKLKKFKTTLKRLIKDYYVGQVLQSVQVVAVNGLKSVLFKVGEFKALAHSKDAVEGDVGTMTKDELHLALDETYPDGSTHKCRIKSINYADLVLIVSLRQEFLEQTCVSLKELEPADFLEVVIKKHVNDGIIVSFGLNLRAIILTYHLKDYQSAKSYKNYPVGKTIKSRVLKVDTEKYPTRVYLTNKDQLMDPEMTIIDTYDKSYRGETVNGVVVKLKHDGLIVELFNNVKGFIPRRFCSSTPIQTLAGLFQVGQIVSCTVYRVEPNRQTLLLGIIPIEKIIAMKKEKKLKKGQQEGDGAKKKSTNKRSASESRENCEKSKKFKSNTLEANENEREEVSAEIKDKTKSRLQRSIESKIKEENIRKTEHALMDKNRPAQSIADFERHILKTPDSANVWIKYSDFFLDNVETEKARIVCRRALKTINFRKEKEKLRIWLQLIKIEAKFGGTEQLRKIIEEALQTSDKLELYRRAAQTLVLCDELDEAEALHEAALKLGRQHADVWLNYIVFMLEHKKDLDRPRQLFERAAKSFTSRSDLIYLRSRFAHLEFKFGDVERGKTLFENLLSENPKRMDIWKVYEDAVRKYGTRQLNTDEVREQNDRILERIATLKS